MKNYIILNFAISSLLYCRHPLADKICSSNSLHYDINLGQGLGSSSVQSRLICGHKFFSPHACMHEDNAPSLRITTWTNLPDMVADSHAYIERL